MLVHLPVGLFVLLDLLVPGVALACPVCGLAGVGDNAGAYGMMSVILSLLPLAMIAAVATWLVRRVREAERPPHPRGRAQPSSAP